MPRPQLPPGQDPSFVSNRTFLAAVAYDGFDVQELMRDLLIPAAAARRILLAGYGMEQEN